MIITMLCVTIFVIFVFLYLFRNLRDLHSFPTRRSSDLCENCHTAAGWRPIRAVPEFDQDRKSTRLNSSHSSISYAVFCLKKKNGTANVRLHFHVVHFMRRSD